MGRLLKRQNRCRCSGQMRELSVRGLLLPKWLGRLSWLAGWFLGFVAFVLAALPLLSWDASRFLWLGQEENTKISYCARNKGTFPQALSSWLMNILKPLSRRNPRC